MDDFDVRCCVPHRSADDRPRNDGAMGTTRTYERKRFIRLSKWSNLASARNAAENGCTARYTFKMWIEMRDKTGNASNH
jgi:hypothetical protein